MSTSRTPQQPTVNRAALAPGIIAAIVLLAGLALIGGAWYLYVQYAVAILALIMCVFAGQAKQWWWLVGLVPIAVVWNPVWPLAIEGTVLRALHVVASVFLVCAAVLIKIPADTRR
ncbi:hypothetical protein IT072_07685 [Leifsonia sp. ZF2019]|uniref:DUF6804 family protein n=1 Tax=Leifsonia sp. ZF2019 TaxID=2781978 RepID=UPI001CBAA5E8|nr:DUF6804 family protein [Leifsonia sp. ZF2019]UAJ80876.1 hypothetical protein IT072_07685 [Leifsonia sp. ZF2019]